MPKSNHNGNNNVDSQGVSSNQVVLPEFEDLSTASNGTLIEFLKLPVKGNFPFFLLPLPPYDSNRQVPMELLVHAWDYDDPLYSSHRRGYFQTEYERLQFEESEIKRRCSGLVSMRMG